MSEVTELIALARTAAGMRVTETEKLLDRLADELQVATENAQALLGGYICAICFMAAGVHEKRLHASNPTPLNTEKEA